MGRRGFTALGKDLNQTIARISVDFAEPTKAQNLLHTIAAKGGRALHTYLMTWLSPECTLFSQANWMNVTRGCAHGAAALDPRNLSRSTPERQEASGGSRPGAGGKKGTCGPTPGTRRGARNDVCPGATSPQRPVGPARGRRAHRGQPIWAKLEVDQCAYGRGQKKPSIVMTNCHWQRQSPNLKWKKQILTHSRLK